MMPSRFQILSSRQWKMKSLKKHLSMWMFFNGRTNNQLERWCTPKWFNLYGIVECH
jgi:hypothetical protein